MSCVSIRYIDTKYTELPIRAESNTHLKHYMRRYKHTFKTKQRLKTLTTVPTTYVLGPATVSTSQGHDARETYLLAVWQSHDIGFNFTGSRKPGATSVTQVNTPNSTDLSCYCVVQCRVDSPCEAGARVSDILAEKHNMTIKKKHSCIYQVGISRLPRAFLPREMREIVVWKKLDGCRHCEGVDVEARRLHAKPNGCRPGGETPHSLVDPESRGEQWG